MLPTIQPHLTKRMVVAHSWKIYPSDHTKAAEGRMRSSCVHARRRYGAFVWKCVVCVSCSNTLCSTYVYGLCTVALLSHGLVQRLRACARKHLFARVWVVSLDPSACGMPQGAYLLAPRAHLESCLRSPFACALALPSTPQSDSCLHIARASRASPFALTCTAPGRCLA